MSTAKDPRVEAVAPLLIDERVDAVFGRVQAIEEARRLAVDVLAAIDRVSANDWFSKEFAEMQGRDRCCDQDYGGSHYHCGNCGKASSMLGHYIGKVSDKRMSEILDKPIGWSGFTCDKVSDA